MAAKTYIQNGLLMISFGYDDLPPDAVPVVPVETRPPAKRSNPEPAPSANTKANSRKAWRESDWGSAKNPSASRDAGTKKYKEEEPRSSEVRQKIWGPDIRPDVDDDYDWHEAYHCSWPSSSSRWNQKKRGKPNNNRGNSRTYNSQLYYESPRKDQRNHRNFSSNHRGNSHAEFKEKEREEGTKNGCKKARDSPGPVEDILPVPQKPTPSTKSFIEQPDLSGDTLRRDVIKRKEKVVVLPRWEPLEAGEFMAKSSPASSPSIIDKIIPIPAAPAPIPQRIDEKKPATASPGPKSAPTIPTPSISSQELIKPIVVSLNPETKSQVSLDHNSVSPPPVVPTPTVSAEEGSLTTKKPPNINLPTAKSPISLSEQENFAPKIALDQNPAIIPLPQPGISAVTSPPVSKPQIAPSEETTKSNYSPSCLPPHSVSLALHRVAGKEDLKQISGPVAAPEKKATKNEVDVALADEVRAGPETKYIKFCQAPVSSGIIPPRIAIMFGPEPLPRLNVVLDLDLTLAQAFVVLDQNILPSLRDNPRVRFFPYGSFTMAVILRPHVRQFLERINQFADVFVYTHGEKQYAEILLDKFVDPQKRLVRRDRLWAVEKGENKKKCQRKCLENLFGPDLAAKVRDRTVIYDDQPTVWEASEQSNIIASMKFAPIQKYDGNLKEPNKYYFGCLEGETLQRFTDNELPHIEGFGSRTSQLKYVGEFMKDCYLEHCISRESVFATVLQRKLRTILAGCLISPANFFCGYGKEIRLDEELIRKQYLELALRMGAEVSGSYRGSTHFIYLVRRQCVVPSAPEGSFSVHVYFVLHSYFNCCHMPEADYQLLAAGT